MINLRYHVVSLIAVFLALGLGVLAGTTVTDEGIVKVLRRQTETLRDQRTAAEQAREAAEREVEVWERFGEPVVPAMMRGRLAGVPVVLLVESSVGDDLLEQVDNAVAGAGGRVAGSIRFSDKWPLRRQEQHRELAGALGSTRTDTAALLREAASRVASRLRSPADPFADGDLIDVLSRAGFLTLDGAGEGPFPPARAAFVYLSAGAQAPSPADTTFTLPLLRAMGTAPRAAVAEPLAAPSSLADRVRGERDLLARIATVDHVDTMPGRLALVAGLRDVIDGRPPPHYGVGRRTSGVAPPL